MPSKRQQRRKQQHERYKSNLIICLKLLKFAFKAASQSTDMDVDSSEAESASGSSTSGRPKGGAKQAAHPKKRWEKNAEDQESEGA